MAPFAGPAEQDRSPGVVSQLDALDKAVRDVLNEIDLVTERLGPVLRQLPIDVENRPELAAKISPDHHSQIMLNIMSIIDVAVLASERLRSLRTAIQL